MEGPSLYLAVEQLTPFKRKVVLSVAGNTKIEKERMDGKRVEDIFSWAKHLIFQFDTFALKVHFLLYGSFEATVNKKVVTGDYVRTGPQRLTLRFSNGEIRMFNCSVKLIDDPKFRDTYDFTTDVMSPTWDGKAALKKALQHGDEEIADVLLDQDIFGGVGNIIKNEVLFLARINPKEKVADIPRAKLREIVERAQSFSQQFYEWRKIFQLKANLKIYRKSTCPICGGQVKREKHGTRQRMSFYCPVDQPLSKLAHKYNDAALR